MRVAVLRKASTIYNLMAAARVGIGDGVRVIVGGWEGGTEVVVL